MYINLFVVWNDQNYIPYIYFVKKILFNNLISIHDYV